MAAPQGQKKFKAFLDLNGIGPREAGKALGVTHAAVIGWRDGKSTPTEPARVAIEVWTNGAVRHDDWTPVHELAEHAKFADVVPFKTAGEPS